MKSGRRSAHANLAPRRMEPRDPPAGRARFPQADEVGCTPQDRFGIGGILRELGKESRGIECRFNAES